jgi:hypothetical protein
MCFDGFELILGRRSGKAPVRRSFDRMAYPSPESAGVNANWGGKCPRKTYTDIQHGQIAMLAITRTRFD